MPGRIGMWGALALTLLLASSAVAEERREAYLGVYLTELSDATRTALGLDDEEGILIERVIRDQPADEAGIEAGDVLIELAGQTVHSSASLGRALDRAGTGKAVAVSVLRRGKRTKLEVTLGEKPRRSWTVWAPEADEWLGSIAPLIPLAPVAPEAPPFPRLRSIWRLGDANRRLGVRTTELTGQLAEYFEVARGLLVTWVIPDSPAGRVGVQAGDIMVSLGGQPIGRGEDLRFILATPIDEDKITLDVVRRGQKRSFALQL